MSSIQFVTLPTSVWLWPGTSEVMDVHYVKLSANGCIVRYDVLVILQTVASQPGLRTSQLAFN